MRSIIPLVGLAAMSLVVSVALANATQTVAPNSQVALAPAAPTNITLSGSSQYLADTLFAPGDVITFSIMISNSGSDKAFNVSAVDPLPFDLALLPHGVAATQGTFSNSTTTMSWTGAILPGTSAMITMPVTVTTCQWPITNTSVISYPALATPITVHAGPIEGFEWTSYAYTPTFPPPGWTSAPVTGTSAFWSLGISGTISHPSAPYFDGNAAARFNAYSASSGDAARLSTRLLNFPQDYTPRLTFWMYHDSDVSANTQADRLQIQLSTDGGGTYADIPGALFTRYDGRTPSHWSLHTVDMPGHAGQSGLRIGFLGVSDFGNNIVIDAIGLQYVPTSGTITSQSPVVLINKALVLTGTTAGASDQFTKTWNFGAETSVLAGNTVTHTYAVIGSKVVTMSVCGLYITQTVYVSHNPVGVDLTLTTSHPALMTYPVYLTPTVSSATLPVTSTWDFGDGTITNGLALSHTYNAPGLYTATLRVTNTFGTIITTTLIHVLSVANLSVTQQAEPLPASVTRPLTYTIVVSNAGPADATGVRLTDTLPIADDASLLTILLNGTGSTNCGQVSFTVTCTVGILTTGGAVTISLVILPGPATTAVNEIVASSNAVDLQPASNTSILTLHVNRARRYLPIILSHDPPIPDAPILNAIDDPYANGAYTVSWTTVPLAQFYTLQESTNPALTDAVTVYSGANHSWSTQNKSAGAYYYRVNAGNVDETGAWSLVQSISFTLLYDGSWSGVSTQSRPISLNISQNSVDRLILNFYNAGCTYALDRQVYPALPINGRSFMYYGYSATFSYVVSGTLTSETNAAGTIAMTSWDMSSTPQCIGTTNATWTATKKTTP